MKLNASILTIAILTIILCSCETKIVVTDKHPIAYGDTTAFLRFCELVGTKDITGFQSTYKDSVEHILVTITINNPTKIGVVKELLGSNKHLAQLADSVIYCLGYDLTFDSLIVNYTQRNVNLVFDDYVTIHSFYNADFIHNAQFQLFFDIIKIVSTLEDFRLNGDLYHIDEIIDSLSQHQHDYFMVLYYKIQTLMMKEPTNYILPKEMLKLALSQRPYEVGFNFSMGLILLLEKKYQSSSEYFDVILRQEPNHTLSNYYRGYLYIYAKDTTTAMQHFLRVKASGSDDADNEIKQLHKRGY